MESELVSRIANEIVTEQILHNWLYWTLLLAALTVGGFFGALLGGYATKSGQLRATTDKFEEIVDQLRTSTRVTEEIRSAVSLGEWTKKEQIALRRLKLEELMIASHGVDEWFSVETARSVFSLEEPPISSGMNRLNTIGLLYFPELESELAELRSTYAETNFFFSDVRCRLADAKSEHSSHGDRAVFAAQLAIRNGAVAEMAIHYEKLLEKMQKLDDKAADVMTSIMAEDVPSVRRI